MDSNSPDRIVELWPHLSADARNKLIEFAERIAEADSPLELSAEEEAGLARARLDFEEGRTVSFDEFCVDLDEFMDQLKARSRASS